MRYTFEARVNGYQIYVNVSQQLEICLDGNSDFDDPQLISAIKFIQSSKTDYLILSQLIFDLAIMEYTPQHRSNLLNQYYELIESMELQGLYFRDGNNNCPSINAEELELQDISDSLVGSEGYVYILSSESGLYKIGRTINPVDRQKTFDVKLPFMIAYKMLIKSNDHRKLEKVLHQKFKHCRVAGEWFDLNSSDLKLIREIYASQLIDVEQYNG